MGRNVTRRWNSVDRWGPTLFLVGGTLLVGHAVMSGVHAFTTVATPPDVFVTTGHFVALVGLFGLYPVLASRSPTLTLVAGATSVVALVSWFVMTATQFLALVGVVASLGTALPEPFFAVVLASTILTYGLFGFAALRVDARSRKVGLLVLAPAVLTALLVVDSAITGVTALDGLFIGGGLALSMLSLGYTLRTWEVPDEHATPVGDPTVG